MVYEWAQINAALNQRALYKKLLEVPPSIEARILFVYRRKEPSNSKIVEIHYLVEFDGLFALERLDTGPMLTVQCSLEHH